jgi:hypothetical protein
VLEFLDNSIDTCISWRSQKKFAINLTKYANMCYNVFVKLNIKGDTMGSVIKKRRKRMSKKKHRKLLRKTRHQRKK